MERSTILFSDCSKLLMLLVPFFVYSVKTTLLSSPRIDQILNLRGLSSRQQAHRNCYILGSNAR